MSRSYRYALTALVAIPFALATAAGPALAHGLDTSHAGHSFVAKHDTTASDDCDPNDNGKSEGFFGFLKQDASEDCRARARDDYQVFGDDEEQRDQDRAARHGHPCNRYHTGDECNYYNRNGRIWSNDQT